MSRLAELQASGPSRAARAWRLAAALLLLGAVAFFTVVNLRAYFTVSEVRMPNIMGMQQDQAALLLRREGLEPVFFPKYVQGAPASSVTSQAPEASAIVKRGRTVSLGVNSVPADARLPDMVGMRESDALARVNQLNLPTALIVYAASQHAPGTVIGQLPEGGSRLAANQRLELTVSRGPDRPRVTLPDLQGQLVEQAVTALRGLGFQRVETLPSAVSFTAAGTVVSMHPPMGANVSTATPVVLHYALSSSNVVSVPDVYGFPQWRAQLSLQAAQLRLGPVTYVQDPSRPQGVVEVRPTGYTLPGTPIFLTVNGEAPQMPLGGELPPLLGGSPGLGDGLGGSPLPPPPQTGAPADEGARVVPFTFDPTFMGVRRLLEETYSLRLVVNDDLGERTVLEREMQPGEIATTSVTIFGSEALLQTFIDEVFFQAWRP